MTHITEARVIGKHADMGGPAPAAARMALTVTDVLRAGAGRSARRASVRCVPADPCTSAPNGHRSVETWLRLGRRGIPRVGQPETMSRCPTVPGAAHLVVSLADPRPGSRRNYGVLGNYMPDCWQPAPHNRTGIGAPK
jgi:hypothetical protein